MPDFTYTAKNNLGHLVEGTIAAAGHREAVVELTRQSLFPMRVKASGGNPQARKWFLLGPPRVKSELVAITLSQLADLLAGGVPLIDGLEILATQTSHPTLRQALEEVRDDVADGAALDEAFARHPRIFPDLIVSIVRAGSAGAFLEEALERTSDFLGMQEELKAKVKGAMTYPAFLAVMGTCVITAMIVFFVPKFAELFEKLEQQGGLPWTTSALLWLSDALWKYGIFLIAAIVGAIFWWKRYAASPKGREQIDAIRLKLPLLGPILQGFAIGRCCRVLGTLLKNGVPLLKSLGISADAAGNKVFSKAVRASASNVSSGDTLAKPLEASKLFPPEVMAMVRIAEESNNLDSVLLQIADRTELRNMRKLDVLVRLVEPMMLMVMGVLMLLVILALLLPVFEMSSTV